MAGAYQKKSRWNRRIAVLAAILAALAAAASFWLALGKTCRLQLKTDLSGLSPTVSGVFARAQLPFQTQVQALQMDSDVSVSELYAENSVLGQRLAALTALGETIQRALDGLSADSHGSVRWDELDPTMFTQLSAQIGTLRVVLALLGLLLVGLLVGGVLLALLGRRCSGGRSAAAALRRRQPF